MVVVLSAILIEKIYREQASKRLILLVGEASYILYLIHPYVIYGFIRLVLGPTNRLGAASVAALVPVLMAVTTAIAVLIHVYFEKPIMGMLRQRAHSRAGNDTLCGNYPPRP